jgi:hypothetical protein
MADASGTNATGSRFENMGKRFDRHLGDVVPRVEEEIRKVIVYLNDEVVPHLRQDSSQALRIASEQLRKIADRLDDTRRGGGR